MRVLDYLAKLLEYLAKLSQAVGGLGQLLGAIGLILAALTARKVYYGFQQRTLAANWMASFREIVAEFWTNQTMAEVRNYIANENKYKELDRILEERLASDRDVNTLDPGDNAKLGKIDRFCALLARTFMLERDPTPQDERLWSTIHGTYWLEKIQKPERLNLKKYIEIYWPELNNDISFKLFVYGALRDQPELGRLVKDPRKTVPGVLKGYELRRGERSYVVEVEKLESGVQGLILLEYPTANELKKLDQSHEAYPVLEKGKGRRLYIRKLVEVSTKSKKVETCWAYVANERDWPPDWLQPASSKGTLNA